MKKENIKHEIKSFKKRDVGSNTIGDQNHYKIHSPKHLEDLDNIKKLELNNPFYFETLDRLSKAANETTENGALEKKQTPSNKASTDSIQEYQCNINHEKMQNLVKKSKIDNNISAEKRNSILKPFDLTYFESPIQSSHSFISPMQKHFFPKFTALNERSASNEKRKLYESPSLYRTSISDSSQRSPDASTKNSLLTSANTYQLKKWLLAHHENPYPTKGEKIWLALTSNMSLTQVSTWFANARRRMKKDDGRNSDFGSDYRENNSEESEASLDDKTNNFTESTDREVCENISYSQQNFLYNISAFQPLNRLTMYNIDTPLNYAPFPPINYDLKNDIRMNRNQRNFDSHEKKLTHKNEYSKSKIWSIDDILSK